MTDLTAPHADGLTPPQVQMPKDRTRGLVILGVSLVCVLILMVVFVLRNQGNDPSVSDTENLAQLLDTMATNAELTGCRSQFAAQLVSGPQAVALKALADYGVGSEFQAATSQLRPAENAKMVALSVSDPDEFLKVCHATDFTKGPPVVESAPGAEPGVYQSCGAAVLAGDAPLRRGQPGYNPALDSDHDGIACE